MKEILFGMDDLGDASSPSRPSAAIEVEKAAPKKANSGSVSDALLDTMSPVEKLLALPELPELRRDDRAMLLMQSPNRLFFYWTLGGNPYQSLARAIPGGGYTLAMRLVESGSDIEDVHPVEAEGSSWFDVRPDTEYRVEIGFYSPSRPFVRVLFSNAVRTPRKGPSPNRATAADWSVSPAKFVEVLDVSGFVEDAVDVATAMDEEFTAEALATLLGLSGKGLPDVSLEEISFAAASLAAGEPIESLKWKIGAELYALLQAEFESVRAAVQLLGAVFGIREGEGAAAEYGPRVYGSSLINFPRRRPRDVPRYRPVSSFGLGRDAAVST